MLLPITLWGQNLTKHKLVVAGLNNYMEFINETTHAEFLLRSDLINFNSDLLSKYKYPKSTISFYNRDRLYNATYYKNLPSDIYQKCLDSSFPIEIDEKYILDSFIKKMWQSIQNLQFICDTIEIKVKEGAFEDSANIMQAYELLERAKFEFYSYFIEWHLLKNHIDALMRKYEVIDSTNPYIKTAIELDTLFKIVYNLAEDVRTNDTNSVKLLIPVLKTTINKFDGKADKYLIGAKRYSYSNGNDPYYRFDNIIKNAKAELTNAQYFVKPTKYPQYTEKKFGKSDYYYNEKILNKFNRQGIGMAYDYNIFAENSDNLVLKKAQIPHTLIVIYPDKLPFVEQPKDTSSITVAKYTLENAPAENLIFLLDVSNSMNMPEKMPLLKKSIKYLLNIMRNYDNITIVTYSGTAKLILPATKATQKDTIVKIIDGLIAGGATNLYPGLKISYSSAVDSYIKEGNNRIILATDGKFTIDKKITNIITKNAENIHLSILYFGKYQSDMEALTKLSELGKGNCTQITPGNIDNILVKEAGGRIK